MGSSSRQRPDEFVEGLQGFVVVQIVLVVIWPRARYARVVTSGDASAGIRWRRIRAQGHGFVTGNGRNGEQGVVMCYTFSVFDGKWGKVTAGTTTRSGTRRVNRVNNACMKVDVSIRLESQGEALVALQADSIVLRSSAEHPLPVHVVAARTIGYVLRGVATEREIIHLTFVALATEKTIIFIAESQRRLAADCHATPLVHIVAIGTCRGFGHEVGGGEKPGGVIGPGCHHLPVALGTTLVADCERALFRVVNKMTESPTFPHVVQTGAVT
jgi:hypothetical protein